MGASSEILEAVLAQDTDNDLCEYHTDNELAFAAFRALQTQWYVVAGAVGFVYLGLNYSAFPVVMDALCVPRRRRAALIAELRIMESAALPIMNAKRDDSDGR